MVCGLKPAPVVPTDTRPIGGHTLKFWQTKRCAPRIRRALFTAVIGDVIEKMGLQRPFLPPRVGPLRDDMVVIGCAMPVRLLATWNKPVIRRLL